MKKELREKVWNKYDQHCSYCGCELKYKEMQVDHIRPKSLFEFGSKEEIPKYGVDDFINLNPSCRQCNFYKGAHSLEYFRQLITTLHERLEKQFIVRLALKFKILKYNKFNGKFFFEKINHL